MMLHQNYQKETDRMINKKILLVEESDTTRGVAETILRQNGYEVISVSSPDKALEVIQFTKPNIIVMGADLQVNGNTLLLDRFNSDHKTASIPKLLMANPLQAQNIPENLFVSLPLDPKLFLEKINRVSSVEANTVNDSNHLNSADLDDEFLDEALGLDRIEVTDSEIMDKTVHTKKHLSKNREKIIGMDIDADTAINNSDSGKVESIMITEDSSEIINKPEQKDENKNLTGGIDIISDQFGMENQDAVQPETESSDHDYEWFINEMKNEVEGVDPNDNKMNNQSHGFKVEANSSFVDPITPDPVSESSNTTKPSDSEDNVDGFIEEFKKEVEKIHTETPDSMIINDDEVVKKQDLPKMSWEEKLESLTPDQLGLFTTQFSKDLAGKIAEMIINKIDEDKLLALIKSEIITHSQKK